MKLHAALFAGVIGFVSVAPAHAALIFGNSITGTDPGLVSPYTTGQTVAVGISATGIARGSGVVGVTGDDRYNARAWNPAALDANDYFSFAIQPLANYELDLTDFIYSGQASGTGPVNFAFRSSLDGFAADVGLPTGTGTSIDLSAAIFQGLTSPVEFRLYGWGASGSTGTFSVNEFSFNGTVTAIPEPASAGWLVLTGVLGIQAYRKRFRHRSSSIVTVE